VVNTTRNQRLTKQPDFNCAEVELGWLGGDSWRLERRSMAHAPEYGAALRVSGRAQLRFEMRALPLVSAELHRFQDDSVEA
jgi:hypothetical protein